MRREEAKNPWPDVSLETQGVQTIEEAKLSMKMQKEREKGVFVSGPPKVRDFVSFM